MKKRSSKILLVVVYSFIIVGFIEGALPEEDSIYRPFMYPHALVLIGLTFSWWKAHSNENGVALPNGYSLLTLFISPLAISFYFLKSFGIRSGIIRMLKMFGFLLVSGVCYNLSFLLSQALAHN